jgi:hypothetical protein
VSENAEIENSSKLIEPLLEQPVLTAFQLSCHYMQCNYVPLSPLLQLSWVKTPTKAYPLTFGLCVTSRPLLYFQIFPASLVKQKSIHSLFSNYRLIDEQLINDRNKIKSRMVRNRSSLYFLFQGGWFMYTHWPLNRDLSRTTLFSTRDILFGWKLWHSHFQLKHVI